MKRPVRAFGRAVIAGTLVGGAPAAFMTIPIGILLYRDPATGAPSLLETLYFATLPFSVSLAFVLTGSALIGLPAHLVIRKYKIAHREAYLGAGAATGFLLTLAFLIVIGSEVSWICLLGGFSGFVTALSWSKSVAESERSE